MKRITYGFYDTQWGTVLLAHSDKGVCWLSFCSGRDQIKTSFDAMKTRFPQAVLEQKDQAIKECVLQVFKSWEYHNTNDIPLDMDGTDFQKDVWQALLKIPRGETRHYSDVANDIGKPDAVRAVGTAVGANPIALLVPCHRVIPKTGSIGNYAWGSEIKKKLLEAESALAS